MTHTGRGCGILLALVLGVVALVALPAPVAAVAPAPRPTPFVVHLAVGPNTTAVANFTASLDRLVELVGLAGSSVLTLVWARVALSWFSNDVTKKVQAKDRARDALIGTLLFTAAVSGLAWGLARWVLTGA